MLKSSELYKEARRSADMACRGVSPPMFKGLSSFEKSLTETGENKPGNPREKKIPTKRPRPARGATNCSRTLHRATLVEQAEVPGRSTSVLPDLRPVGK